MYIRFWDDKYSIKSDSRCYIISQISKREEDNEEVEVNLSFHATVAAAIKSIAEREGRSNDATNLKEYVEHMEMINRRLEALVLTIAELIGPQEALERALNVMPEDLPDKIKKLGEKK